jgi:hypothetical protein
VNARAWLVDGVATDSDPTPARGVARPKPVRVHPVDLELGDAMLNGWRVSKLFLTPMLAKDRGLYVAVRLERDGRERSLWWPLHEARSGFVQVFR